MKIKTPLFVFSTVNISLNCFADVSSVRIFFSFERDLIPFHESPTYLKKKTEGGGNKNKNAVCKRWSLTGLVDLFVTCILAETELENVMSFFSDKKSD